METFAWIATQPMRLLIAVVLAVLLVVVAVLRLVILTGGTFVTGIFVELKWINKAMAAYMDDTR